MIPQKKHPSSEYRAFSLTYTTCREAACPGAANDFFSVKFVGRSKYCLEISIKVGKGYPVPISSIFSFKIVERVYENRNRGDLLTVSEYWEFFLVLRGNQTIHFPPRKFVAPDLLWSSQRLFRCARLTNPAIECSSAKMYYNTYALKT